VNSINVEEDGDGAREVTRHRDITRPVLPEPNGTMTGSVVKEVFQLKRKGEGELVNLDKVINHKTGPGNPSQVTVANEV